MTSLEIKKLERVVLELVKNKFKDKVDCGGTEYIHHLLNVAQSVENEGEQRSNYYDYGESSLSMFYHKAFIVALLHDILEDTDTDINELVEIGCDDEIINAVVCITRVQIEKKYEPYFEFIERVKKNDIARLVKIKDLEHNMDIRRLSKLGDYELKRLKKYWYCWKYLKGEISDIEVHNTLYPNDKWR